jgi:hypothetical protein
MNMGDFPEGFVWIYKGQAYLPVGLRQTTNKAGEPVVLVDWRTDCADCGVAFVVSTPRRFEYPNRRCDACKQPGKRVPRRAEAAD